MTIVGAGYFAADLMRAVQEELAGVGLNAEVTGERKISLRPAGLHMRLKLSRPVETGVSTFVWATFEVPVLGHLDCDAAMEVAAALNRRYGFFAALAGEDMVTFMGRDQLYVGAPRDEGVRRFVRRALLTYNAAQDVTKLLSEGFWEAPSDARPVGASSYDLRRWHLDEEALGEAADDLDEAGPLVTRMVDGLGLAPQGPARGSEDSENGKYEFAGYLAGVTMEGGHVRLVVDLDGGCEEAPRGVRVDIGGRPFRFAPHATFLTLNNFNRYSCLKETPPAAAGCWSLKDDGLWLTQVLPPAIASRDALLDAVAHGLELYRQASVPRQPHERPSAHSARSAGRESLGSHSPSRADPVESMGASSTN